MTATSATNFQIPSEPRPMPLISSDDDEDDMSFVVLGKSLTDNFHEPVGTSIVQETQNLISQEIAVMDASTTALPKMPEVDGKFVDSTMTTISINSVGSTDPEDLQTKVCQLIEENLHLKDTIQQNNISMKSQYEKIVVWQEDVKKVHNSHKEKIMEAKNFIEKLKMENVTIQQEFEKMKKVNEVREKELTLLQSSLQENCTNEKISESSADNIKEFQLDIANKKIRDMEIVLEDSRKIMEKLECENAKLKEDFANERAVMKNQLENMETKIKTLNGKTEALVYENNNLKGQMYHSEQEMNLHGAEEIEIIRQQLMNAQVTITQLEQIKAENIVLINANLLELNSEKDNVYAMQAQLELYKTDFEAERGAKETIKSEKDQLSEDLQHLQRRNQQLQEEIEVMRERNFTYLPSNVRSEERRETSSHQTGNNSPPLSNYACPICNAKFRSLRLVEEHVETCIHNQP